MTHMNFDGRRVSHRAGTIEARNHDGRRAKGGGIMKTVLPVAGAVVGTIFGGPVGGAAGAALGTKLSGGSTTQSLMAGGMSYLGGSALGGFGEAGGAGADIGNGLLDLGVGGSTASAIANSLGDTTWGGLLGSAGGALLGGSSSSLVPPVAAGGAAATAALPPASQPTAPSAGGGTTSGGTPTGGNPGSPSGSPNKINDPSLSSGMQTGFGGDAANYLATVRNRLTGDTETVSVPRPFLDQNFMFDRRSGWGSRVVV